jgi:NADH:ubiquinone reductase (H+-translocating)
MDGEDHSMKLKKLAIVGGGFAGVWASAAAAGLRDQLNLQGELEINLFNKEPRLTIRPRLYEKSPKNIAIPLAPITRSLGVNLHLRTISEINLSNHSISASGHDDFEYQSLVLTMGSLIHRPQIPGVHEFTHDIDSVKGAAIFWSALQSLIQDGKECSVAVIGAGLTGLELVTEVAHQTNARTILIDSDPGIEHKLSSDAAALVNNALAESGTETHFGKRVVSVDAEGIELSTGERVDASLVVWAAGMRAHPLTRTINAETDHLGRLKTDEYLAVNGFTGVYSAGDSAATKPDGIHTAPMSCQFAMPTGIIAGYNAVAELFQSERKPFFKDQYVTCIDLGKSGALFTLGWEGKPVMTGDDAKNMKKKIMNIIYPPADAASLKKSGNPDAIISGASEKEPA